MYENKGSPYCLRLGVKTAILNHGAAKESRRDDTLSHRSPDAAGQYGLTGQGSTKPMSSRPAAHSACAISVLF
ncbi:hypothetical protein DBV23_10655 [Edwardsiella ictaluri]|uniref:Uncharacterized protein n=1 Tax=Edwardsiella ictaluri (strain 93-146) TaxID=634503 RepID=C5BAU9_EDWI9|nr:hypothetical protein NT01EI_3371 [Edwardsiella ictaluri 93-146]ARD39414.1 hypothetical protein B6E78_08540 [Edwardsiella ictaluri]AVZ82666.1 hypothetical protein DBV23_10655 [Edwardsiella ictaluri]WJH22134.1 hypothetical protein FGU63_15320 [Edwardsiella ictaluri]